MLIVERCKQKTKFVFHSFIISLTVFAGKKVTIKSVYPVLISERFLATGKQHPKVLNAMSLIELIFKWKILKSIIFKSNRFFKKNTSRS